MNKTDIDWAERSWNPVTGCLHDCEYCYARGQARRFGGCALWYERMGTPDGYRNERGLHILDKPLYRVQKSDGKIVKAAFPFYFEPTFHRYRLEKPAKVKKPSTIFVGSMCDLFGEWVPDKWITDVFEACEAAPQHRYMFLTKNPVRYNVLQERGLLPDSKSFWFGYSAPTPSDLYHCGARNVFVSIEPLLSGQGWERLRDMALEWVIIGAMTGSGSARHQPQREWIDNIVAQCRATGVPVFMKDSLISIVGVGNMLREFPESLL